MPSKQTLNRLGLLGPLALSAVALAIVVANVLAKTPPSPDEGTSAHLFQLAIVAEAPLIALFAATADWRRISRVFGTLMVQALAIGAALGSVGLAGY